MATPTGSFWTETIYDQSPLVRISEHKAPGLTVGVRTSYEVVNENIKYYYIDAGN